MQIRLTVLAPHTGHGHSGAAGRSCDVLVTAPAGTALAAVASGLAAAVAGPDSTGPVSTGPVVLYAGQERLDAQRCALGEPPLVDGAVLSLGGPGPGSDESPGAGEPAARLHVVAGPDAGGVHLLHGGAIRVGRSLDADVPLDDPDVSRIHCTVTVEAGGRVTVADLGSTNGTSLDGAEVGARAVPLPPGALLRLGESALRLTPPASCGADAMTTAPDGEGHLRVTRPGDAPAAVPAPAAPPAVEGQVSGGTVSTGAHGRGGYGSPAHPGADDRTHGGRGIPYAAQPAAGGTGPGADDRTADRTAPAAHPYGADEDAHARAREHEGDHGVAQHSRTGQTRRQAGPAPDGGRKRGLGAWARRLAGGKDEAVPLPGGAPARPAAPAPAVPEPAADTWPDPAAVLLTALGPGPRLWERGPEHPEALGVRLGTADRAELAAVPVTVGLREAGSLGLAGPRERLAGLARSVVAQLAALHSPADLELVLIAADRARPLEERRRTWGWLGWLPHLRPAHGQDCRLLLAYDREQAAARTAELTRRLDDGPLGPGWASADRPAVAEAAARYEGPRTVVIVDGDPGSAALRETTARLAGAGAAAGIHLICLAEAPSASPTSPVAATYETACAAALPFRECGAAALLSGDVATALRLLRTAGGRPAGHGTMAAVDAVSPAWAERFARALAPLRAEAAAPRGARVATALPPSARLLDELGLARATPASLMARWAAAGEGTAVLGAGPHGPVAVDLVEEGPHLLIEGGPGSGRTELLRALAASLAAAGRPDRLGLLLVDGAGGERGEGLAPCTELPHVTEHLVASDPVRMRAFAQALGAELKRRAELLAAAGAPSREPRVPDARTSPDDLTSRPSARTSRWSDVPQARGQRAGGYDPGADVDDRPSGRLPRPGAASAAYDAAADLGDRPSGRLLRTADVGDAPSTRTARTPAYDTASDLGDTPSARARRASAYDPGAYDPSADAGDRVGGRIPGQASPQDAERGGRADAAGLPRLVVLVDDYDALVAPALGSPGRPAAGSVVRALEAVARNGERLGVHLVATSGRPDRTADTELAHGARLRIVLDAPPASAGPDDPAPGRGRLGHPDGRVTPFQGGRVTGRIPRTATLRPTVVPLEWERMGDPPSRRPVRELGNGPTDLALLASALDRAARSVNAAPLAPLTPANHA
ncbi:FtsK/SpoIIIE domain-containing protein [Streptomyces sp. NPDC048604]|uniref:FtsK/SpoIIIE domain-containing protein n=1 Tax=Streptomyces sp. NPDC048604 TaxID=3365578 RepID=UPI00371B7318